MMSKPSPAMLDASIAVFGVFLIALGATLIYMPAGIIAAGVGLFYLGALHR